MCICQVGATSPRNSTAVYFPMLIKCSQELASPLNTHAYHLQSRQCFKRKQATLRIQEYFLPSEVTQVQKKLDFKTWNVVSYARVFAGLSLGLGTEGTSHVVSSSGSSEKAAQSNGQKCSVCVGAAAECYFLPFFPSDSCLVFSVSFKET